MKNLIYYFTVAAMLGACASKEPEKKAVEYKEKSPQITTTKPVGSSVTTKLLASEQGTDLYTEIDFMKGSAKLSQNALQKIKSLQQKAKAKGNIDEVQVITWADKEYPSNQKEELDQSQKDLVEKRNKALEKYFAQNKDVKFTPISMAERTTALGRLTASEKTKVKESLQEVEIATTANKEKGPSMVSKSIIMLLPKD